MPFFNFNRSPVFTEDAFLTWGNETCAPRERANNRPTRDNGKRRETVLYIEVLSGTLTTNNFEHFPIENLLVFECHTSHLKCSSA